MRDSYDEWPDLVGVDKKKPDSEVRCKCVVRIESVKEENTKQDRTKPSLA